MTGSSLWLILGENGLAPTCNGPAVISATQDSVLNCQVVKRRGSRERLLVGLSVFGLSCPYNLQAGNCLVYRFYLVHIAT